MGLSIQSPAAAWTVQRNLGRTQQALATSLQRLATGLRINGARDDAAGLAISQRAMAQVRGTETAARNAGDGMSLARTAEGALASVGESLQRIRELAVQSANATNTAADRAALQREVGQHRSEIERIATQAQFNGIALLDGNFAAQTFQVGADAGQAITMGAISSSRTDVLGAHQGFHLRHPTFAWSGDPTAPNLYAATITIGAGPPIALGMLPHDGKLIAQAVMQAGIPGLSADVEQTFAVPGTSAANASGAGNAVFTLNGVAIGLAGVDGAAALGANRATAVSAINAHTAATGVTASDTGSGIALVAPDGRTIYQHYAAGTFAGSTGADFGLLPVTNTGAYIDHWDYVAPPGVSGDLVFSHAGATTTFAAGALGSVATVDIGSAHGATTALHVADVALYTVSTARAALGAAQTRFASVEDNLRSSADDLRASNGRLLDADYAVETATFARGRILQQAGLAMVAQANVQARSVLSLLGELPGVAAAPRRDIGGGTMLPAANA